MHGDQEGLKLWNKLRSSWHEAHQTALAARAAVIKKQIDCAARRGPDPSDEELAEVERLEAIASHIAIEMDNFVKNRLG